MYKATLKFFILAIVIFFIDQYIKMIFLNGFGYDGPFISLMLTFNRGVAFSMFEFLGNNLKYIQIIVIICLLIYLLKEKKFFKKNSIAFGILIGAACSNISDRFVYGGVVDYVYWHKWFEFAIFNFADVMIDFAVLLLLINIVINSKKNK